MAAPTSGLSMHVTITVAPSNAEAFLRALKPCFDRVTAEPLCTFFQVFQDPEKPGRFRFVENWSMPKERLIKEQLTKSYYDLYIEETTPMWIEPRQIEIFDCLPGWTS